MDHGTQSIGQRYLLHPNSFGAFNGGGGFVSGGIPPARVIQMDPVDPAEDARWQEFCKPTRTVDSYGMTRLTYAKPGCDMGRSR
jgi:hypothetical protein